MAGFIEGIIQHVIYASSRGLVVGRGDHSFISRGSEDVIKLVCFGKKGHESSLCLVLGEFVPVHI
jgi:hypothetical protein